MQSNDDNEKNSAEYDVVLYEYKDDLNITFVLCFVRIAQFTLKSCTLAARLTRLLTSKAHTSIIDITYCLWSFSMGF